MSKNQISPAVLVYAGTPVHVATGGKQLEALRLVRRRQGEKRGEKPCGVCRRRYSLSSCVDRGNLKGHGGSSV